MRELKFRGYHEEKGMFPVYGLDEKYVYQDTYDSAEYLQNIFPIKNVHLMQYTGLEDKNGIEIYEGDIIKVIGDTEVYYDDSLFEPSENVEFELITEVFYNETIASFDLSTIEADLNMKHWGFYGEGTESHLEVIGNIHQNPELINY